MSELVKLIYYLLLNWS